MKAISSIVTVVTVLAIAFAGCTHPDPFITILDDPPRVFPVEKRMRDITLPDVEFRAAHISDVFDCLDNMVKRHGTGPEKEDSTRVRISFVGTGFYPSLDDHPAPILPTFAAKDISLLETLKICCAVAHMYYRIDGNMVIVDNRDLGTHRMDVEMRMCENATALPAAQDTRFALFYSDGMECRYPPQRNGAVLTQSLLISQRSSRAVVIAWSNAPAQVFELAIPETPQPQAWSAWQPPAYFAPTSMWSMSSHPAKIEEPAEAEAQRLELRYRIKPWVQQSKNERSQQPN